MLAQATLQDIAQFPALGISCQIQAPSRFACRALKCLLLGCTPPPVGLLFWGIGHCPPASLRKWPARTGCAQEAAEKPWAPQEGACLAMPQSAPPMAQRLFAACTQRDPAARPSASTIVNELRSQ